MLYLLIYLSYLFVGLNTKNNLILRLGYVERIIISFLRV